MHLVVLTLLSIILFFGVIRLIIFEKYNDDILDIILYIFFIDLIYNLIENICEFINDSYDEE
jgi:hypothetical protein